MELLLEIALVAYVLYSVLGAPLVDHQAGTLRLRR